MDLNKQNPASHAGLNGVQKSVLFDGSNKKNLNNAVALSPEQIDQLLGCLPARANQAKRFVRLVGENPESITVKCNIATAGVNLSDIARKYNPYLRDGGYELRCRLPDRLIKNRFGESTMQHLWGLYEVGGEL